MAGDPRIPATAPTTQAAPKLGRSIAAIVPPLSDGGKLTLSGLLLSITRSAVATSLLSGRVFWRPFMTVFAVCPRFSGDAGLSGAFQDLVKIDAAFGNKGVLKRLSRLHALLKRIAMNAADTAPFGKGVRLAIRREVAAHAPVVHLNTSRSPSAVIRLIIAVVVDAIQRHLRPRFTHISKEVFELPPPLTNVDAATTVFIKMRVVRVPASLPHSHPNRVRPRAAFAVCDPHGFLVPKHMNGVNHAVQW